MQISKYTHKGISDKYLFYEIYKYSTNTKEILHKKKVFYLKTFNSWQPHTWESSIQSVIPFSNLNWIKLKNNFFAHFSLHRRPKEKMLSKSPVLGDKFTIKNDLFPY